MNFSFNLLNFMSSSSFGDPTNPSHVLFFDDNNKDWTVFFSIMIILAIDIVVNICLERHITYTIIIIRYPFPFHALTLSRLLYPESPIISHVFIRSDQDGSMLIVFISRHMFALCKYISNCGQLLSRHYISSSCPFSFRIWLELCHGDGILVWDSKSLKF